MNTKNMLMTALLAVFAMSAQAQLLTGKTARTFKEQKGPRTFLWTARVGYSSDAMTGSDDVKSTTGFDGGFGFTHYLGESRESGLFWGFEARAISSCAHYEVIDKSVFGAAVVGVPRVGYKYAIPNTNFAVAPYVGAFVGFMFDGHESQYVYEMVGMETYKPSYSSSNQTTNIFRTGYNSLKSGDNVTAGMTLGVQFFLTKGFFVDMHIMKSFMEDGKTEEQSSCYIPYGVSSSAAEKYSQYQYDKGDKLSLFKFVVGVGFEF